MSASSLTWAEKTCVVTGATNGIGLVVARELARLGMRTVIVGRDAAKTTAAVADVRAFARHDRVEHALCDFSKQADIRALSDDLHKRIARLDVLVNNAGVMMTTRHVTVDGFEQTFAVNHLGYFLLTNLLLDVLKQSAPARIVSVASAAHQRGRLDFDDLNSEKSWNGMRVYGTSKLENILFTRALAKKLAGTGVTATCVHPGFVGSGFASNNGGVAKMFMTVAKLFARTPEEGARVAIYAATSPDVDGVTGAYFADDKRVEPSSAARDDAAAQRLWEVSAKLTGLSAQ